MTMPNIIRQIDGQTEPSISENQNFNGIDLVKFICAYLVCMVHISLFSGNIVPFESTINQICTNCIGRLAVPFYFTASGFFLFRKMDLQRLDSEKIKSYCFKILRFYGIWCILLTGGSTVPLWFLVPLWYLGGLVVGVLVFVFLKKHMQIKSMAIIAGLLYCIGLLGDAYYGLAAPLRSNKLFNAAIEIYASFFITTRNGVFFGFPYILMGAVFAHSKDCMKVKTAVVGLILSLAGLLAESQLLIKYSIPRDYNMYVFLLPSTFFLFYIASHIQLKARPIYKKLRGIGILIYFMHLFIHRLIAKGVIPAIDRFLGLDLSNYEFFVTILTVTVFAAIIEWLSHKKGFTGLRYLYA